MTQVNVSKNYCIQIVVTDREAVGIHSRLEIAFHEGRTGSSPMHVPYWRNLYSVFGGCITAWTGKLYLILSKNCRFEMARKLYGVHRRWGVIRIWTLCSKNDLLLTRRWHFPFCSKHEFMSVHSIPFPLNPSLHLQSFCCFNKTRQYIIMIKTVYIF